MINFDSLILKIFVQENYDFFVGSKIQKIQQPNRSELIFFIRNKGESRKFYINFNPNFYHICFMSQENEARRNISVPKTALMFCMLLRKYIQNAKIVNISVPEGERIFEIYFEHFDEMNEKTELCLAVELMGKYSNVILYNYDTNIIIGCAHNVSSEKSRERELLGLMPYIYPPKQNKTNLLKTTYEDFKNNLDESNLIKSISSLYNYLTSPVVQNIYDSITPFSYECLYTKLKDFLSQKHYSYFISQDYSVYSLFETDNSKKFNSINEMIDDYFSFHQNKFIKTNLKQKISKLANARLKKLEILKNKQNERIDKIKNALEYKTNADLLMANLYNISCLTDMVCLKDFEGKEVKIPIDKNFSITENANKYYSLYKKTKVSYQHALSMIEETKSQILYYEELIFFLGNTDSIEDLTEICDDIFMEKATEKKDIVVDFSEYEGFRIYIGKNKKQNDYILSKVASADDLWFHPLNAPGAHVLVKVSDKSNVPDSVILKAAQLTKEYSSQKNNSKTSVIYTKRKYVKKANNKLAFVTYKNETEVVV